MPIKTAEEYVESLRRLRPTVYILGERVRNVVDHPLIRPSINSVAATYELAHHPEYEDLMTATSHLTGERVSRFTHIFRSTEDLVKKVKMIRLCAQKVGTCFVRCLGLDALNTLSIITYEIDRKRGTNYAERFNKYLRYVQENDLTCHAAMTDVKGDRSKRPSQQADPDLYLHVVERRDDGIVVRGAKIHQSGAIAAEETIVIPGTTFRKGEEDYAVAFAVPNGAKGLTYISQYTPQDAERMSVEDVHQLGNPRYGIRETCLMVFDDVFIPWNRVFMCGEVKYTMPMWSRFARIHRMTCGGACKVGFGDLMIGAAQAIAEYLGVARASHIREKIIEMVRINETLHACSIAAALRGREEPPGSGVYLPDRMFANVSKLNCADGFWRMMALLGDIAGGLAVTMPSEEELKNPDTAGYVRKYLKAAVPAEKRMRMTKFIQNWVSGPHGVGTWHGAGSPQAQRLEIYRSVDLEEKKRWAERLAEVLGRGDAPTQVPG